MQRIIRLWKSGTAGKLIIGCGGLIGLFFICGTCGILFDLGPAREAAETPYPMPTPILTATPTRTPAPSPPTPTSVPMPTATPTPTAIPIPQRKLDEWDYIEMCGDDLLELWGKPLKEAKVGEDFRGMIVEWVYQDVIVTLQRWELDGVTCYRVHEIRVR